MRKIAVIAGVLAAGLSLWGCGESNIDGTAAAEAAAVSDMTIEVQKDGSIIETITEDFTADYYNEDELKSMVLSEIAEFNKTEEKDISVDKFENKKGIITVVINYPSAEAYTNYNSSQYDSRVLFFGTIAEAYDQGYPLNVALKDAANEEEKIGREELLGMGEKHILISEIPCHVKTFGRILYVSDNVTAAGKNQAIMETDENGEDTAKYYIIFK